MSAAKRLGRLYSSKVEMTAEGVDELDKPPNSFHVTYYELGVLLYSIVFHFVDVGFDLYLAYTYFITGKYAYFSWTVGCILIPTIIITLISVRMYSDDCEGSSMSKHAIVRIVLCTVGLVFQLALLIRYWDSLLYAIKSLKAESNCDKKEQKKYYNKMLNEDSDVALLRVFKCYLKSAPQQVLQISLLLIEYSYGSELYMIKQCFIISINFIAMGCCMATYHRCIRFDQNDKNNISILGTIFVFFWHLNVTVSRILAISAMASMDPFWAFVAVAVHWCGMGIWVSTTNKTAFCGNNLFLEFFFSCATGLVYIFNYINLRDGPTRKFHFIFYGICFVENVTLSMIWILKSFLPVQHWLYYNFAILPVLSFITGIACLGVYYTFLHPSIRK